MCNSMYPKAPASSRFVAPWDTSGWYAGRQGLGVGTQMYTNSGTQVRALPAAYLDADYVQMFDAEAQGFDDKQEVCFRVECDAVVGVAPDPCGPQPAWLSDYVKTDGMLISDLGSWPIFERSFPAGALVTIPGMTGRGHHYFPMIRKEREEAPRALPDAPWKAVSLPAWARSSYRCAVREVFAQEDSLARYETADCAWVSGAHRGARIAGHLSCDASTDTPRCVLEAALALEAESAARIELRTQADAPLFAMTVDGDVIEAGKTLSLRVICDSVRGEAQVWLNSRKAYTAPLEGEGRVARIRFAAESGVFFLDHFSLSDDTEIYAVDDGMRDMPEHMDVLCGDARREPFPFEENGSVALVSGGEAAAMQYRFAAMEGAFTFETKVRCETDAYCEAPVLLDESGTPILRVALYKNNLYATDGGAWKRLMGETTDWAYYPCGNWLLINLKVDLVRGTYDLFVDGARRATGFALEHAAQHVSSAGFRVDAASKLYVRCIRVYDDADFSRAMLPDAPVMDVRDFGAVGDGTTLDTAAIQSAVEAAARVGGTVYLSGGVFLTGSISLRSDVTFWVDRTAVLLGTQDHTQYPLHEPGTSLCAVRQLGRGLLYGENVHNVRITGGGMLDGNGLYRFKQNDPMRDRQELARPSIIYITYSSEITVENIHLRRSCFWSLVPLSCRNVLLRHLNLDCMYTPNRDGIDPVDVCDATIYDCAVMAGDDGLCFKSSDAFGCARIDVYDMMIQSLASGIKFGTDTYYGLEDAVIADCTVKNVNRCGISLEAVDGAHVERVRFERIDMVDVGAPAYVVVGRRNRLPRGEARVRASHIDGVTFKQLRFEKAYPFSYSRWIHEVMVVGQDEERAARNVRFEDCVFELPGGCAQTPDCPKTIDDRYPEYDRHGMSAGSVFTTRNAPGFEAPNLSVQFEQPDAREQIVQF